MEKYITIWSRSLNYDFWIIERSGTESYYKSLGFDQSGEKIINNRLYKIFPENYNPNKKINNFLLFCETDIDELSEYEDYHG